jgi:hypothetical protein
VVGLTFTADGKQLLCGCADGEVMAADATSGAVLWKTNAGHPRQFEMADLACVDLLLQGRPLGHPISRPASGPSSVEQLLLSGELVLAAVNSVVISVC